MTLGPMEENRPALIDWARRAQAVLLEASSLQKPFFESPTKLPHRTELLVGQLGIRCTLTSDSVLLLVGQLKFWDAEILARSVLEGTFRVVYLCSGSNSDRDQRTREFLDELPDIARLRRHRRLERFFAHVRDSDAPEWRPLRDIMLSEQEKNALWTQHSKARRSELEQKWSLPGLTEELAATEAFSMAGGLMHTYGMSSHLVHLDGDAVLTMSEREHRNPARIAAIELAHGARLLGDVMAYASLRTIAIFKDERSGPRTYSRASG